MTNLNLLFNKLYSNQNNICNTVFNHETDYDKSIEKLTQHSFLMETVYPGVIIGSGNPNGTYLDENRINMGFSFDYVSGQPIIPGSSVKGVLRSHFKETPEVVAEILKNITQRDIDVKELEKEIFDGKDVFFDAIIYDGDSTGKIIGSDFLAPHPEATKAPIPIQFIKVVPGVRFRFAFCFSKESDSIITDEQKLTLFRCLIELFGIGAKTNTGYGRMKYTNDKTILPKQQPVNKTSNNLQYHNRNNDKDLSNDTIICKDCGAKYTLNNFEQDKVNNEGWTYTRCRNCRTKQKNR